MFSYFYGENTTKKFKQLVLVEALPEDEENNINIEIISPLMRAAVEG